MARGVVLFTIRVTAVRVWLLGLALAAAMSLCSSCSNVGAPADADTVSATIVAAAGGVLVHPRGATLTIPAGALSADSTVTLTDRGESAVDPYTPMVPVSRRFEVSLGGATALAGMGLALAYSDPGLPTGALDTEGLVMLARDLNGVSRLKPSDVVGTLQAGADLRDELVAGAASPSFELQYIPHPPVDWAYDILQAPYYCQDGLAWCEPTSIAMLYNFHEWSSGSLYSSWGVAGSGGMERNTTGGAPPDGLLEASGAAGHYAGYYWDADLIPSAPFVDYVRSLIHGWDSVEIFGSDQLVAVNAVDPRPIQTTSESSPGHPGDTLHGYLIVGATEEGVYIHDSSGALTGQAGIATFMTWADYRNRICKDGDMDAWTARLDLPVRPETERRGSIVLLAGANVTLTYEPSADNPNLSYDWLWDGDPHEYGYRWTRRSSPFEADADFESAFELNPYTGTLTGVMHCVPRVANVTSAQRTYTLYTDLWSDTERLSTTSHDIVVPGRSWQDSSIPHTVDMTVIDEPGTYRVRFLLYENDVLQDSKAVLFRVVS